MILMGNNTKENAKGIKRRRSASVHYVDNSVFYEEMCKYLLDRKLAVKLKKELPAIPDYIGECFLKISTKLSNHPSFVNYPHKDEMIGDGLENCFVYIDRFNPDKSKNPFAYFTQIAKNGYAKEYKKIYKHIGKGEKVEFVSLSHSGESEIYTI